MTLVLALAFVTLVTNPLRGDIVEDFTELFGKAVERQNNLYGKNRKITIKTKLFKLSTVQDKTTNPIPAEDSEIVVVKDAEGRSASSIRTESTLNTQRNVGGLLTKSNYANIISKDGKYSISTYTNKCTNRLKFFSHGNIYYNPVSSYNGAHQIAYMIHILQQDSPTARTLSLDKIGKSKWKGRDSLCVEISHKSFITDLDTQVKTSVSSKSFDHFDPLHHHIYLGSELRTNASYECASVHTRISNMVYDYNHPEGIPIPKRFTKTIRLESGTEYLIADIMYTGYEKYVPNPSEFRLETKYGITTPAEVDCPDPPINKEIKNFKVTERTNRPWYLLTIAAGVLLAGFVVYFVRKRRLKA